VLRFRAALTRLVAAVLLLQVAMAPAHCLAMAAAPAGMEAVICSAEGTRTIHLGPDGQEMPAHDAGQGFCAACPALPHAVMPTPPAVPPPAWVVTAGWGASPSVAPPPPARAPPFASRAPPAFG
jgi:hypothetical protein